MSTLHTWAIHMLPSQIPRSSTSLIFLPIFLIGLSHFLGYYKYSISITFLWSAGCLWFCFVLMSVLSPEMKNLMKFLMSLLECVFLLLAWKYLPIKINIPIFPLNLYFITYWIHFCLWLVIKLINCFHMMECHCTITLLSPSLI